MTRKHRPHAVALPQPDMIADIVKDVDDNMSRTARALHMSRRALDEGIKAAAEALTVELAIYFIVRVCWSIGAVSVAAMFLR